MIGSDGVRTPESDQSLNLGDKTTEDLIENDVKLAITGTDITVTGTVKNITEPWKEFSTKENTGHFFPIQFPAYTQGKEVTLKGSKNGDKTITVDEDLLLIQRLENLKNNILTCEMGGKVLMKFDFTGVTLG